MRFIIYIAIIAWLAKNVVQLWRWFGKPKMSPDQWQNLRPGQGRTFDVTPNEPWRRS